VNPRAGAALAAVAMAALLVTGLRAAAQAPAAVAPSAATTAGPAAPSTMPTNAPSPIDPIVTNCNTTLPPVPPAKVTRAIATSGLPCEVSFEGGGTGSLKAQLQSAFDFYSWLTFVALNVPASGKPGDAPAAWQNFQDLFSTMLPGGMKPPSYGHSVPPPAICPRNAGATDIVQMVSKTPDTPTLQVAGQPLRTGPLIDQHGKYARYQLLLNKPMFEYVVANKLYSKAQQQHFASPIVFPAGSVTGGTTGTVGAIVVKAAWKVLDPKDPNDNPALFHSVVALVYTPAAPGVKASCKPARLGLVGLHIVHKTKSDHQWIWSTFEHVRNAPPAPPLRTAPLASHYNFYNPACPVAKCPLNAQPPQPWNPSVQPVPGGFHSQIVRATKYEPEAVASAANWNAQFHAALAGTVWANYQLITTQWPTTPDDPVHPQGQPFPLYAANTTMETYVQGNVPLASSSCMACHGNATTTAGKPSDFTFVLERAH
jgi:hypothetical protein